jgi:hypothetical protein
MMAKLPHIARCGLQGIDRACAFYAERDAPNYLRSDKLSTLLNGGV